MKKIELLLEKTSIYWKKKLLLEKPEFTRKKKQMIVGKISIY
jgi:hypothetical protein